MTPPAGPLGDCPPRSWSSASPRPACPRARVGTHIGPVVFQNGDYFGRTVNIAARIGDYARPGEVLVSAEVVAADRDPAVRYDPIGPVSLKGLSAPSPSTPPPVHEGVAADPAMAGIVLVPGSAAWRSGGSPNRCSSERSRL
jgi:hypothetical protein